MSMSERFLVVLVALATMLGIPASGHAVDLKVGLVVSETGPSATYFKPIPMNAAKLAIEEVNARGKVKLNVLWEDDQTNKQQAINAFQKLIDRDKVHVINTLIGTGVVLAAGPVAQQAGVPVVLGVAATPGLTRIGDYIFRTSVSSDKFIPTVTRVVASQYGVKTVALMGVKDDQFAVAEHDAFKANFTKLGPRIAADETMIAGELDIAAQAAKIVAARPDAVVLSGQADDLLTMMRQIRKAGLPTRSRFIGGVAFTSVGLIKKASALMEGTLGGTSWFIDSPVPKNRAFVKSFKAKFNADPDFIAAQEYDAIHLIADAAEKAGLRSDMAPDVLRKALRAALASIKTWEGVLGTFRFAEDRDAVIDGVVLEVKGGKLVLAK